MLFFLIQGLASAATVGFRPSSRHVSAAIFGTLVFNLATSYLFFQSVDQIVPFYSPRY
jgi:hypothetical protein